MKLFNLITCLFCLLGAICLINSSLLSATHSNQIQEEKKRALDQEGLKMYDKSLRLAKFYDLSHDQQIKDVTIDVLSSSDVQQVIKDDILRQGRRIYVFQYPSDGLNVKGFISFARHYQHQPLLIFLRGGNRVFGIPNPGMDIANYKDYTVIATTYRGGVSEGEDEFGGQDVNDVKSLVDFIPQLERLLNVHFQPNKVFMMGGSRGGLEMFQALARYPDLQDYVDKVVSLSGLLDLRRQMQDRPEMRQMFEEEFGLSSNDEEWINYRDPIQTVFYLKRSLPILIVQGTNDQRINIEEGHHMVKKLEENGNQVTYWEFEGGDHTLSNLPDRMNPIANWLELE